MYPACRGMIDQRALLPFGGFGIIARRKMRTADADEIVERKRILRREVERDLETFDGGFRLASIGVDPPAAAPGPRRSAVKGERLSNDEIRGLQLAEQRQGVAEDGQNGSVAGKRPRLLSQLQTSRAVLLRLGAEMIDHALNMGPRRERCRQRMLWILLHRAIQQFERTCISLGIEREHARHGPECEVVGTEVCAGFSLRVVDFRKPKAWLQRGGNPGGELLLGSIS